MLEQTHPGAPVKASQAFTPSDGGADALLRDRCPASTKARSMGCTEAHVKIL